MLKKVILKDIFEAEEKHIAFSINTEGYNDECFAADVAKRYWPEIEKSGKNKLGEVIPKKVGDKTFYAIVCYSLQDGWDSKTSKIIKECFDKIETNGEPIATIPIGTAYPDRLTHANFREILQGMQESKQDIVMYSNRNIYELQYLIEPEEHNNKSLIKK